MENIYAEMSNDELQKKITDMTKELERRIRVEKENRWDEVRDVLYKWMRDYGEIDVNSGDTYISTSCNFDCPGEIMCF